MRVAFNSKGFGVVAVVVLMHTGAFAQQDGELQQRLHELKQQYEQTTQHLQQRIGALEQQIEQQKEQAAKKQKKEEEQQNAKTVSAAELGRQQGRVVNGQSTQVGSTFQGKLPMQPTYDELQEAETKIESLQRQVGEFEFHGYLRSGYGLNSEGGQQVAFEAPGALAEYRLGNEAETYGEFIFVNNWLNSKQEPDRSWMKDGDHGRGECNQLH